MELNKFDGVSQCVCSPLTPNSISISITELEFSKAKEHLSILANVANSLLSRPSICAQKSVCLWNWGAATVVGISCTRELFLGHGDWHNQRIARGNQSHQKCGYSMLPPYFQSFSIQRWTLVSPSARQRRIISDGKSNIIARKESRSETISTFIILLRKSWCLWINPVSKGYLEAKGWWACTDKLQDLARGTCTRDRNLCKAKVDNPGNVEQMQGLVWCLTKIIPTQHSFRIKNGGTLISRSASSCWALSPTKCCPPLPSWVDLWQLCLHIKSAAAWWSGCSQGCP